MNNLSVAEKNESELVGSLEPAIIGAEQTPTLEEDLEYQGFHQAFKVKGGWIVVKEDEPYDGGDFLADDLVTVVDWT